MTPEEDRLIRAITVEREVLSRRDGAGRFFQPSALLSRLGELYEERLCNYPDQPLPKWPLPGSVPPR